jgi:hypothetical protein
MPGSGLDASETPPKGRVEVPCVYQKPRKFGLDDLSLYFDTVAKDRLDAHASGQRNAELLDIRDQMMRLTDQEFQVLMRTFRAAVKDMVAGRQGGESGVSAHAAQNLYNELRPGAGAASTKVSAIS